MPNWLTFDLSSVLLLNCPFMCVSGGKLLPFYTRRHAYLVGVPSWLVA